MARIYCQQCGMPLPRRVTRCLQCDTPVPINTQPVERRPRSVVEWLAICCVAAGCLVFVLTLGLTNLFRDGGLWIGALSLFVIVLCVYWVGRYEPDNDMAESSNP
ncbi:MAG: hypothetical protein U9R29_03270 [Thermodesulfobacteriota bacterium]|nr:hypothetical protein [Thermodesulfobacteriota bacterium]